MSKRLYSDYIGDTISIEITPFQYSSAYSVLYYKLFQLILNELPYNNGLCCGFKDIKVEINNKITVSGIVTHCTIDCG